VPQQIDSRAPGRSDRRCTRLAAPSGAALWRRATAEAGIRRPAA